MRRFIDRIITSWKIGWSGNKRTYGSGVELGILGGERLLKIISEAKEVIKNIGCYKCREKIFFKMVEVPNKTDKKRYVTAHAHCPGCDVNNRIYFE